MHTSAKSSTFADKKDIRAYMNEAYKTTDHFEAAFEQELTRYLLALGKIDEQKPDCPDVADLWEKIGESYLPDGIREFNKYPTVSLGWMMFIGMAIAKYWDEDWTLYSNVDDLYIYLRDRIDFDHMDDYITEHVLVLNEVERKACMELVAECASRTVNLLRHMSLEPGTAEAFRAYIAALHQMYVMGIAVQLKAMGYHMRKM